MASDKASAQHADQGGQTERQWDEVRAQLRRHLGDAQYGAWLQTLRLEEFDAAGIVTLSVEGRFRRDWIDSHLGDALLQIWSAVNADVRKINLVNYNGQSASKGQSASPELAVNGARVQMSRSEPAAQAGFSLPDDTARAQALYDPEGIGAPFDPDFTFDNFVVGKSNEFAHAAAFGVASSAGATRFNPLFLYGGVGLGKTHLMHAIAWEIRARHPERKVMYLSAEKFMYQFIKALRGRDTMAFKEALRSVDILMVDDVQFIGGKGSTQDEFFHTFNALVDNQKQLVISADRSPSNLDGIEERIKSRLSSGLVADIHPTDYELRLGILQTKAKLCLERHPSVDVPKSVLEFLAQQIASNVRELEGALTRIIAYAELVGQPVTTEMTREVMADLLRGQARQVTIDEIQRKTAEYYSMRLSDLLSPRRSRNIARPRQIAMYLSKQLTSRSLPEIGRKFGGRDHTTVIHAVRRIEELRGSDPGVDNDVENLQRLLQD
ncbi:MAG TPA: chromosomal replication initiator protein DnaA [Alphaproteobacteria bacterium]|nr:chromosomal replication initiator protein DnaA [Alphaproteobacteria bacterium]HAM46499.1 chromosomal replication initiator protein DnaA [Alphaproteobacteria bacterium]HBC54135.1 chromosomal replication initiator protein DnaA [Alphaproteobacteria bacterium]HCO92068.1 chromosomal replication initiator protein DnaA [Alphaproteobacteria bacterium]